MRQLLLSLLIAPGIASAAIVDFGDYLRDTTASLEWLDVTKTVGLAYTDVQALVDTGGSYKGYSLAGWRIASANELDGLVTNAVGESVVGTYVREDHSLYDLIHFLSPIEIGNAGAPRSTLEYWAEIRGLLSTTYVDSSGRTLRNAGTFRYFAEYEGAAPHALTREVNWYQVADVQQIDDGTVLSPPHGTFLVRAAGDGPPPDPQPVPEPSTIGLLASACIALVCGSRRARVAVGTEHVRVSRERRGVGN